MFNFLKIKIITSVALILLFIIASFAYLNYLQQKEMLHEIANRNSSLLIDTIKSSVGNAMLTGHSGEVGAIFTRIKSREFVKSIRILDSSGKVLNSADPAEIGTKVADLERPPQGTSSTALPEKELFFSYARIYNAPECYRCHPPARTILGLLEIKLSLDYMSDYLKRERDIAILSSLLMIVLIFSTICVFLTRYVDAPLRKLIRYMRNVEEGDFEQQITLTSSAEMSSLGESFNGMVLKLKTLMATAVSHERTLATAREKLNHHQETEEMNQRLEEQIREIENLNVSLEERVEEIEEANYKIADLASELEDKNINLEKAVAKLSTLYRLGLAINSTIEVEQLYQLVVKTTTDTLQAQIGYITLQVPDHDELEVVNLINHGVPQQSISRVPMSPSSVATWVIRNRKPLLIADIDHSPEFARYSPLGFERKSVICAPLLVKDEVIGALTVANKLNNADFSYEEMEHLSTIAAQASIAIKNAKLYDEQQKTYLNTIQALVSAIEASDSYTRGHSERVTRFSVAMARELELPQNRLKVIERAAILHDIGKIGIDLSLLHKKEKLTPEDVAVLHQHPTIGMKILEPIEFLQDVRLCIGQHHERFDGKGYPNRVTGEKLLLESRILSIADSFDAMTSDRPYRSALKLEVAIKELTENAGTQFDPALVPIFVRLLQDPDFLPPRKENAVISLPVNSPLLPSSIDSCVAPLAG